jgi:NADH:ubiquinone oxidoreductase subunit 5 (subunit L)/multisubunit Na+/H+ antiporter MnhA subunit
MGGLLKKIGKFGLKVFITAIMLIGLAILISYLSKMKFSDTLVYGGFFCILVGGFSLLGSNNNSADATYFMSKSVGTQSTNEITEENYKNRNNSMRFLIFMSCVGGILIGLSALIEFI